MENNFEKNNNYYQIFKMVKEDRLVILGRGTIRVSQSYLNNIKKFIDNDELWLIDYDSEDGQNISRIRELQKNNSLELANRTLIGVLNDYPKQKTLKIYEQVRSEFEQNFPGL